MRMLPKRFSPQGRFYASDADGKLAKQKKFGYILENYEAGTFNVYSGCPFEMVWLQAPANLSKFVNPKLGWLDQLI